MLLFGCLLYGYFPVCYAFYLSFNGSSFGVENAVIDSRNTLTITTGLGAVYNFLDFNMGVFVGVDFAMGSAGQKWNYDGRPWIGFGVGYNIAMIGNQGG